MVVTLDLPDNIAPALTESGDKDLRRLSLEGLAIEGYREQRLRQRQVSELLGMTRIEAEDFLAAHIDLYDYDPAVLRRETEQLRKLSDQME